MALIKCSECGKEISDKATACVHCGCPVEKPGKLQKKYEKIYTYMCMSNKCLSNPFKELGEYYGKTYTCPDCGNQLEYYETEVVDCDTELVVERIIDNVEEQYKNSQFQTKHRPTCPYCHSYDTKKISGVSRMTSVGFWGLMSKKIGKQWHCNQCGSNF